MAYIWRGTLLDPPTAKRVVVYFAGWLGRGWPNLTTDINQATLFLSQLHARNLLRDTKKQIPWMRLFTVAKHPAVSENRD